MGITAAATRKRRDIRRISGDWTASAGEASFTQTVSGDVAGHGFEDQDADTSKEQSATTSVSLNTTTGISTITVYPKAVVTRGRWWATWK